MAWNLFKKKKTTAQEDATTDELIQKINKALQEAKDDKRAAEKEIEKIKDWAAEAIVEAYADIFPNGHLTYYRDKYKDDALQNYEKIKSENTEKIGAEKAAETDKLVKAYMAQIKLRKSKLELYDKLVEKYEASKTKWADLQQAKTQESKLDKHKERLKSLDGVGDDFVEAFSDTEEMKSLQEEFELRAEYTKQLALLNKKYTEENTDDYTGSLAFKEEIDKMIQSID